MPRYTQLFILFGDSSGMEREGRKGDEVRVIRESGAL